MASVRYSQVHYSRRSISAILPRVGGLGRRVGVSFLIGSQEPSRSHWIAQASSHAEHRFRGRCRLPIREEAPRRASASASSQSHRYGIQTIVGLLCICSRREVSFKRGTGFNFLSHRPLRQPKFTLRQAGFKLQSSTHSVTPSIIGD